MQYPQTRYSDTLSAGIGPSDLSCDAGSVPPSRTQGVLTIGRLAVAGGPNVEDVYFTNVAGNTITIAIRGLSQTALTPTNVPGNQKTHLDGESIEITTHHNYITDLLRKSEDDTVTGNITFNNSIRTPGVKTTGNVQVVTVSNELVPVNYLDVKASAAGSAVKLAALGSDTDISVELQGKGAGVVIVPDKSTTKTSAAPTADAQIANKKYVDDQTLAGALAIVDKTTSMYLEAVSAGDVVAEEPTNNNQVGTSDAFFGRATAAQGLYQAMPFRSSTVAGNPFSLQIYMAKVGSPADTFHLEVQTDSAGVPSGTPVTNGISNSVVGNSLNSSYTLTTIGWGAIPTITPGTLYWIVFKRDGSTSDTDYYKIRYTAGFRGYRAPGVGVKKYIAAWGNNTGADDMFDFDLGTSITGGIVKAIYRSENSGRLYKGMLGVMRESAAIGDSNKGIVTRGEITGLAGLVQGSDYYLSATTAGQLTTTVGRLSNVIGVGMSTTKINIVNSKIAESIATGMGIDGGTGADGALTVGAGATTTLNLGQLYQYTSIDINATGTLKFTGTTGAAMLKCQGNFSGSGTIELRNSCTGTPADLVFSRGILKGGNAAVTAAPNTGGAGGVNTVSSTYNGGAGGTSTTASGTPGAGGAKGSPGAAGSGGNSVGGGGGGGGGETGGGTPATNGSAASGNNGGTGGNGASGNTSFAGGGGGGGGGGYLTGDGGLGGNGGYGQVTADCGGAGGNGGASGATGGIGGNGGVGGAGASVGKAGGNGGWGYSQGGNGGNSHSGIPGIGGAGGNSTFGAGGAGGAGGVAGSHGGAGGNGRTGGAGGAGLTTGQGGAGGNAQNGCPAFICIVGGNYSFTGTINGQGGDGGAGGNGGANGYGGKGGDGARGSDIVVLVGGTMGAGATVNNNSGTGGQGGLSLNAFRALSGKDGAPTYTFQGNITL